MTMLDTKPAQSTEPANVRQSSERLRCNLSIDDKVRLGAEQADKLNDLDQLKQKLDEFKSNIVKQQKEVGGRISRISEAIRNGYEFREVTIDIRTDYATATITRQRLDTGEVYESRPFTSSESQQDYYSRAFDVGKESPLETLDSVTRAPKKRGRRRGSSAA